MKEDLHSAQFLIIKNPKWGISLVDINDDNGSTAEVLDTLVNIFIHVYQFVSLSINQPRRAFVVELKRVFMIVTG